MLKIFKIISVLFIILVSGNLNAQYQDSFDKAPPFIPLEGSVINGKNNGEIGSTDNLPAAISYAAYIDVQTTESKFASIPLPAGTPFTNIGSGFGTTATHGADFGPGGVLYAVSAPNVLVSINLTTGARSTVATITGSTGTITSLAYNELTNTMYLGTTNGETSRLYTLNLVSGAATQVGIITNCPGLIALAINCAGKAYGINISGDNLILVDLTTAAGTVIGPLGFNANYLQDADFDPDSGILYLAAYNGTSSTGELRTVNLNTGASTTVTIWGQGIEVTGYAIPGSCFHTIDVGTISFKPFPGEFVVNTVYNIKAAIKNYGLTNQSDFPVKFFVNGIETGITVASLNTGAEDSVSYSWAPSATGSYQLRIVTALAADEYRANDTVTANVQVFGSESQVIFCDDFSTGSGNWAVTNNGGVCVWQTFNPPYPNVYTIPETSSGAVFSADSDECGDGTTMYTTATLINDLDCSGKENISLSWDNDWRALPFGTAKVEVSYNGGSSWSTVVEWAGVSRRNSHEIFFLPGATNNANVKIRFVSTQPDWSWWWTIDNVCVTGNILLSLDQNGSEVPNAFKLHQNYPNPFNPATRISFDLPETEAVKLSVFDVTGRRIAVLVDQKLQPGSYNYTFNAAGLTSGTYFYRLEAGSVIETKKMMLLK